MLLFYSMSPEQMKSVHYISVWVTSQASGTLNACLLTDFQSQKNFILGAEVHSWYLDTQAYLIYIFFILYFLALWHWHAMGSSQKAWFSSSSTTGKAVHLLNTQFSFVKQILTIFVRVLVLSLLAIKAAWARPFSFLRDFSFHVWSLNCSSSANYSKCRKITIFFWSNFPFSHKPDWLPSNPECPNFIAGLKCGAESAITAVQPCLFKLSSKCINVMKW